MKHKILIDLDHTLFNTEEFRKVLNSPPNKINYRDFLYEDSLPFIKYVIKFGTPVLFTEGDIEFQKKKIENSGLKNIFGKNIKVFSVNTKKSRHALKEGGQLTGDILIDDKPEVLDSAVRLGYKTIRVRRGNYQSVENKVQPDYTVTNLKSIIDMDLLKNFE